MNEAPAGAGRRLAASGGGARRVDVQLPKDVSVFLRRCGSVRGGAIANGPVVGMLGLAAPLVSIVDALSTMVVGGTQTKVYAWYDNEWGYANRLVELAAHVGGPRRRSQMRPRP